MTSLSETARRLQGADLFAGLDPPQLEALAKQRARSKLVDLHKQATEWFHAMLLKSVDAGGARSYLKGRGINGDIARNWRLGFAPDDGGRQFLAWARSKGFEAEIRLLTRLELSAAASWKMPRSTLRAGGVLAMRFGHSRRDLSR